MGGAQDQRGVRGCPRLHRRVSALWGEKVFAQAGPALEFARDITRCAPRHTPSRRWTTDDVRVVLETKCERHVVYHDAR
jgi:hypothetical protein